MSDTTKATKQAKHTPGPWAIYTPILGGLEIRAPHVLIARFDGGETVPPEEGAANARRAVACVNACAGINPEAVPAMLAALEDIAGRGPVPGYGSAGALLVRLAGIQSMARAALSAATGEG